jgi:hypothetical protein
LPEQRSPRVFISYSHDSEENAARVLRLANDLRSDGIEAIIDQYITSPSEGWPRWMDTHVRDDDFVVMVCTETYCRRVVIGSVREQKSPLFASRAADDGERQHLAFVLTRRAPANRLGFACTHSSDCTCSSTMSQTRFVASSLSPPPRLKV